MKRSHSTTVTKRKNDFYYFYYFLLLQTYRELLICYHWYMSTALISIVGRIDARIS
jgi:hypothetical protein